MVVLSLSFLFQNQFFRVAKSTVSGDNNLIACLQSAGNLILLRVLSADADVYFAGFCPGLVQLIDSLAAGRLEEVAARDDQRLFGLSQFDLYAEALSDADILG